MKWFKHVTDASDDEFIAALEAQFGIEGYARWWKMLEAIGKQMKPGCGRAAASYVPSRWMLILGIKQQKLLKSFVEFCQTSGKLHANFGEMFLEIEVPKLLEMADEYSKKSRQTPDKSPDKRRIKEEEVEVEGENKVAPLPPAGGKVQGSLLPEVKSMPTPTPKPTTTLAAFTLPAWVPVGLWDDFMQVRKKKRSPDTAKAKDLLVRELDKLRGQGHPPDRVLEQSIMNGWQGVFPLKNQQQQQRQQTGNNGHPRGWKNVVEL